MLLRLTSIFLLAQQAIWLLVVLPGHERGVITLPGYMPTGASCHAGAAAPSTHSCCSETLSADATSAGKPGRDEHANRVSHCAVCHIAARLTFVVPPDLVPTPTDDVIGVASINVPAFVSIPLLLSYDSTGPPPLA